MVLDQLGDVLFGHAFAHLRWLRQHPPDTALLLALSVAFVRAWVT